MRQGIKAFVIGTALLAPCIAQAQEKVKIGLITTLSGPGGVMGKHQKDGAELALEELGGKVGGLPAELIVGDDQQKPDVGRQVVDGMLKRDKVNFVTGVIFSNVLLAIYKPVLDAKTILVSASGGPSEVAGEQCSPYFFSTSWQNDQAPEAMGKYMSDQKIDSVAILAPNYAAGKDMLAGFKRTYKGTVAAEIYTSFSQADYQSEISQIREKNPKAVFVFYPGGLGVQFVKQYNQSGLRGSIPLYSVYTQNETTIGAIGSAADGNFEAGFWSPDIKNPTNEAFVAAFRKKYNYVPSEYAAANYDAIKLIDSGVRGAGGKISDTTAVIGEMSKAKFSSVRDKFEFNNNQFPIQNYHLFQLAKEPGSDTYFRKDKGVIMSGQSDFYASKCAMKK